MNETIINGILYLVFSAEELQQMLGTTIDSEVGLVYVGPENKAFTDAIIEVPESGTYNGQTVPVVGFAGGHLVLMSGNETAADSVSEVILPQSILFLTLGFTFFTNLQKVTCYAEFAPKLSSEIGEPSGMDFEGTPDTKKLYIPSGSDYSTWDADTTWESVNEIYDGFVEICDGLKYNETSDSTVALIGYEETFTETSITIPSSITHEGKTYTVTEIKNAFNNYTGLTSVTIPNSVTKISGFAFSNTNTEMISVNNISLKLSKNTRLDNFVFKNTLGITFIYGDITETSTEYSCECLGLTNKTISTPTLDLTNLTYDNHKLTIYTIKAEAFSNNGSIITAILPNSVTSIGNYAFYYCRGLTSINIPNSVTSIGEQVFGYCSSLTSITIPDNVPSIGVLAFINCSSLTSITIPNSVTSIGAQAFRNCSSLTSITIPNSVTSIGDNAFIECFFIKSTFINNSILDEVTNNYWGAIICDEITDEGLIIRGNIVIDARKNITSVTIPNSVTSIGDYAFKDCSSLTSITIPNSVTSIGDNAFYYCKSLTSVYLLNPTASTIFYGSYIFTNTPSTKALIVPIGATGYSTSWRGTTWAAVNPVMVPTDGINYKLSDTNTIETFSSNNKVESLTIPSTVTYNGNTYSVNKVSRNSLANDNKMKSLTIESGINKIEASALSGCNNLETVYIPNSVSEIDNHAFWMCKNLKTVNLPNNLTKLKPEMFVACEELQEITIPNGITIIPFRMFEGCKKLTTVNLPSTINKIQWSAFKDCECLTTINIPSGCNVDPTAFEGTNIKV